MGSQWIRVPAAILERERTLGDRTVVKSLVGEDSQDRNPLDLVSRRLEVPSILVHVKHAVEIMVGYAIRPREPVICHTLFLYKM